MKEKGITLIALVVTIVILLILVGVTISQISGENGLFQKAKQAVEKYKNEAEQEQSQLGQLEQYVSDFSNVGEENGSDDEKPSVTITAQEEDVLTGKTYLAEDGTVKTGNMQNESGQTVTTSSVTNDDGFTKFSIPEAGYYDTTSRIQAPTSETDRKVTRYYKVSTIRGTNETVYNNSEFDEIEPGLYLVMLATQAFGGPHFMGLCIRTGENFVVEYGWTRTGSQGQSCTSAFAIARVESRSFTATARFRCSEEVSLEGHWAFIRLGGL